MSDTRDRHQHYYGGQAVIEGVMMRGLERFAVAVRREDGRLLTLRQALGDWATRPGWHKWPLIRGNYMLVESLTLGFRALQFSADVLAAEENERAARASGAAPASVPQTAQAEPAKPLSPLLMGLTTAFALALGLGLFVVLPTVIPRLLWGPEGQGLTAQSVLFNVVEGGLRLAVIVLYVLGISLMRYVRRVFQYHGAEHAVINCFEAGEPITRENCLRYSPLHPRCGTAFLLVVIVLKIILGCFLGWPVLWLRVLLRLALLPLVAALAYEVIRWAGRHRHSLLARALAAPGLLLQMLTTRRPEPEQIDVAIYALAEVAPEVGLPAGWPPPQRVDAQLRPAEEVETDGPGLGAAAPTAGTG